ncbi:MAG: helix-turn-helix transcriptional regulator [Verrucomicrobia bacterium]|nr:helix-turn-helix transcriptional regulator [Verrucomicrobiota bacterium]
MDALPFCKVTLKGKRCSQGPYFRAQTGYPSTPKTIGEAIRKRRLDLGLKQREAAKRIGCNYLTLVNWEKGHFSPRVNHMAGVVQFLGYNPLPTGSTIAEQLVAHRKAHGLTQKNFARELGVDPSTLAKWERGDREPKGNFLERILSAMKWRR